MSSQIALVGDGITCSDAVCRYFYEHPPGPYCPDGSIREGASRTFASGAPIARQWDRANCCSDTFLNQGVANVFVEGKPIHLVGMGNNCLGYTKGPGSPNVFCGN